ncbi:UNVERIFIED_CONTAM: hypothetical protein K2H54_044993 [Gekko kuhli]
MLNLDIEVTAKDDQLGTMLSSEKQCGIDADGVSPVGVEVKERLNVGEMVGIVGAMLAISVLVGHGPVSWGLGAAVVGCCSMGELEVMGHIEESPSKGELG